MARFIRSPHNSRYQASSSEMFALFGLPGQSKWPAQGMPMREIQGIQVWVNPAPVKEVWVNGVSRRVKSSTHRVMAACPDCGRVMSAGRMHQHKCPPEVRLVQLGRDAIQLEEGTKRQIEADDSFYVVACSLMNDKQREKFDASLHRATTAERVENALRILGLDKTWEALRSDIAG